ncbi:MAG: hypothetical protein BWY63_02171 [Chloroflexi bacterium ADurb.Bin360]|nr:MAG: hypothetical protein BWY63_02171 [Chloroflexi bacterium ADurb.Bin360]
MRHTLPTPQTLHRFQGALAGEVEFLQQARHGGAVLLQNRQEKVLGRNVLVFEAIGFGAGKFNRAVDAGGAENLLPPASAVNTRA